MLIDDPQVRLLLVRAIKRWFYGALDHDDLVQEALIHLWITEEANPGNTMSWYLTSCRYHVQSYYRKGRSIDSPKRANRRVKIDDEQQLDFLATLADHDEQATQVNDASASEIMERLSMRLSVSDRIILVNLVNGKGVREIADEFHVSHPSIIKRRRRIARVAETMGFKRMS